jgi:hypothetical protein
MINLRESLINTALSLPSNEILNPIPNNGNLVDRATLENSGSQSLAIQLAQSINKFKVLAMDEKGFNVDYAGLRESLEFSIFRKELTSRLHTVDLTAISHQEHALAFWINLYNALTIDAVITYSVQSSVTEGWLGILRFFRKAAYNVGGFRFSLEDIEHGILRGNQGHPFKPGPQFCSHDPRAKWVINPAEPRIHFALNCASKSCPPINAYLPDQLDQQLTLATRNFVDQEVQLDTKKDILYISTIFKWFSRDFGGKEGVKGFLSKHLPDDDRRAWLSSRVSNARIKYLPYDWSLNT